MSRAVYEDDVIKLLNRGWKSGVYPLGCDVRALPSAQSERQWIPCSKRLPKIGKDVLVCYDFKGYRSVSIECYCGDGKFHGFDDEYLTPEGRKCRKAIAWMPLPEPWKGE